VAELSCIFSVIYQLDALFHRNNLRHSCECEKTTNSFVYSDNMRYYNIQEITETKHL